MTTKVNIEIQQGATFGKTFYWYDGDEVIVPITAVAVNFPAGFPPSVTAASHGLPNDAIPARIVGVEGPDAINTDPDPNSSDYRRYVKASAADTFDALGVNAAGLDPYVTGGFLAYIPPKDITGYKARMHIRKTLTADPPLLTLTTENGRITLTGTEGRIRVSITAADSADLDFSSAVYDLELIEPGLTEADDVVTRLAYGDVKLSKEITR